MAVRNHIHRRRGACILESDCRHRCLRFEEYEIDISPWLPLLCDGKQHTFTMKVAGLQDNGGSAATLSDSVGNSWSLTGKIFIWLDAEGSITTGTLPSITAPQPQILVSQSLSKNSHRVQRNSHILHFGPTHAHHSLDSQNRKWYFNLASPMATSPLSHRQRHHRRLR